jgi:tetratricopeptide (TPR) repeat protein
MKQAEEAVAAKNLVAAANALRIAVSLAPNDVPLADQLDKVERDAAAAMADKYLEQAKYDERRGHMADAAQAYEKVIRGRPNAYVYERAAHCWLEANGDPKKAFDLAKKAVELSPNETAYRITLARVYAKAGMEASALGELERARTIDPGDDTVKDWLKRLKRGEI